VAERNDKDPVFGRLDELDDIPSLPLGLRNGGSASRGNEPESKPRAVTDPGARISPRDDAAEPGPAISVVGSLTTRTQSAPVEAEGSGPGQPGAAIRYARERLKFDTADLAVRTRLSRRIIEDLESNRFDAIPPAYVRGYLRAVARELEADADGWIRSYEGLGFSEPVFKATVNRNASARWGLSGGIWGLMVGAILVSALGLGVYAWTEGNGANPLASLTGWASESVQRFSRVGPGAEPEPDAASLAAPALTEEVQWVPGPQPAAPVDESPGLDAGLVEVEPLFREPVRPRAPARSVGPAAGPGAAQAPPESVRVEAPGLRVEASGLRVEAPGLRVEAPGLRAEAPGPTAAPVAPESGVADAAAPRAQVTVEPEPETPAAAQVPPVAEAPTPAPGSVEAAATGDQSTLSLAFGGTSWIEVRSASDRVALRGIFHAGDERSVVVEMPARVVFGNAPAVQLSRDGRPVALDAHTRADRTARLTLGSD
jgi:cytoskeleton protein RodZ